MSLSIAVVLPTYDPPMDRLGRVLQALAEQTLPSEQWELVLVDNASPQPIAPELARRGHPSGRVVRETNLGLTFARLRGIQETSGALIVFVDDDNLLAPDYLANAVAYFSTKNDIGAAGGRINGQYGIEPPSWTREHLASLAIRDFGSSTLETQPGSEASETYPYFAPVGAGLVVRRSGALRYSELVRGSSDILTDRRGKEMSASGDCELVLQASHFTGLGIAYVPSLQLTHVIPPARLQFRYLVRLQWGGGKSWSRFGRRYGLTTPIPMWTVPVRSARAFFRLRGWTRSGFLKWCNATGQFIGRAC